MYCGVKNFRKPFYVTIGVRVALKIGDIVLALKLFLYLCFGALNLFVYAALCTFGKIAAAARAAKNAPACVQHSVPIRAGAARGKRKLIKFFAEFLRYGVAKGIISFLHKIYHSNGYYTKEICVCIGIVKTI